MKNNMPTFPGLGSIQITEAGVKKLLLNLGPNKASGPDGFIPRALRELAEEVTPSLTTLSSSPLI